MDMSVPCILKIKAYIVKKWRETYETYSIFQQGNQS